MYAYEIVVCTGATVCYQFWHIKLIFTFVNVAVINYAFCTMNLYLCKMPVLCLCIGEWRIMGNVGNEIRNKANTLKEHANTFESYCTHFGTHKHRAIQKCIQFQFI